METYNKDTGTPVQPEKPRSDYNHSGRVFGGVIVLAIGTLFLAREVGVDFPRWVLSWPMFMIALGLYLGFRHSFKGWAWIIVLAIGSVFLMDRMLPYVDFHDFGWPVILIVIGLLMIFRPQKKNRERMRARSAEQNFNDDFIDSTVIFGSVKKNIISKNFRGGDITIIFGGTDINLSQADLNGKVVLDITQIFGGTKLIVPANWQIQSRDVVSIFGGLEDKRKQVDGSVVDANKVLVLEGTCLFGGIDIKSF